LGGFYLPFVSIGSVAFVISIALLIVVPNAKTEKKNETNEGNPLTFSGLFKVKKDSNPNPNNLQLKYSIWDNDIRWFCKW